MAKFKVTIEGANYAVEAPDENTAWEWANATHKQPLAPTVAQPQAPETTLSGLGSEAGKGLVRGASDVGMSVGKGGANAVLGPLLGPLAAYGMDKLSAPSRELVSASPNTSMERMAGTGAEILGGSAVTGGMGNIPKALYSGVSALGGALGEQAGGETGQAIGSLASLPISAGASVAKAIKNYVYPSVGHLGVKAAGDKTEAVIKALRDSESSVPGVNLHSGQASVPANSAEFAALQRRVAETDPSRYFGPAGVEGQQKNAMRIRLSQLVGAGNKEGGLLATQSLRKELSGLVGPKMEQELSAANTAGKLLPKLQGKASSLGDAAAGRVQDVRRLSSAQQAAEDLAQSRMTLSAATDPATTGLPRIAGRYSYGTTLADVGERGAQSAADSSRILGEGSRFAQLQADSLAAHGLHPIDTSKLVGSLEAKLKNPSIGANEVTKNVLTKVRNLVEEWTANGGGVIDAKALHEIRKTAVNNEVEKLMAGAKPSAIKERAASILGKVKPLIDDAIETAGGTGWRAALRDFEQGSNEIAKQKLGTRALELFDKSPKKLLSLAQGNEPEIVEKAFGPGRVSLAKEMRGAESPITDVGSLLNRNAIYKELASKGTKNLENRIGAPELPPTGFFQPMVSAGRGWINRILGSGVENAIKRASPEMVDPKKMAKLMREYRGTIGGGKEDAVRRAALAAALYQGQQP